MHFYPRSPCGERPGQAANLWSAGDISIHALLAESDRGPVERRGNADRFLSTLSLRRATLVDIAPNRDYNISIHALLAESDHRRVNLFRFKRIISIHALLAESDRGRQAKGLTAPAFLSTLSLRRATNVV